MSPSYQVQVDRSTRGVFSRQTYNFTSLEQVVECKAKMLARPDTKRVQVLVVIEDERVIKSEG
jgi:hypothetical protein